jgi:hypothetical protein
MGEKVSFRVLVGGRFDDLVRFVISFDCALLQRRDGSENKYYIQYVCTNTCYFRA